MPDRRAMGLVRKIHNKNRASDSDMHWSLPNLTDRKSIDPAQQELTQGRSENLQVCSFTGVSVGVESNRIPSDASAFPHPWDETARAKRPGREEANVSGILLSSGPSESGFSLSSSAAIPGPTQLPPEAPEVQLNAATAPPEAGEASTLQPRASSGSAKTLPSFLAPAPPSEAQRSLQPDVSSAAPDASLTTSAIGSQVPTEIAQFAGPMTPEALSGPSNGY